jgi:hypothetical protein
MGVKLGLSQQRKKRLKSFENRILRRIFGPKREDGEHCIVRSFLTYTLH